MARKFLVAVDLSQNELQNARLQNLAAAPSSPVEGQPYYDSVFRAAYVWNGTGWISADATKLLGVIPNAALTTNPLARGNHTGTQNAATISDFASTAQGYHLNQFAVPTGNVPMGGFKFTGLATPTTAGDSAEYSWVVNQVQSAAAGIASKQPVTCVSVANIALTGLQTIDGYTTSANDRVLVTGNTTASQNGVYNAASGSWTRTVIDGAAPGEIETGAQWMVQNGTIYAASQWRVSTTGAITIGTTAISIVQSGATTPYTAANGVLLTGSQFTLNLVSGGGIIQSAGGASVDPSVVARKFSGTIGDGAATSIVVTHNLGTQDIVMMVRQAVAPYGSVECDMSATSTNTATIAFASAPSVNAYRVTVLG